MPSTRLLLEGPDIEDLLARVREEHGPGARIVNADKVRTGGVAGFFAREKFAVTIEIDPVSAAQDDVRAPAATAKPAPVGPPPPSSEMHHTSTPNRPMMGAPAVDRPGTLLELADVINAAEAAEASVTMSTTSMTTQTTPAATTADPAAPVPPGLRPLSTEGPDFAAVLARLAQTTRTSPSSGPAVGDADTFVPASLPKVALAARQDVAARGVGPSDSPATQAPSPEYSAAGRRTTSAGAVGRADAGNPLVRRLLSLGLPADMARQLDGVGVANLRERLVQVLADRPLQPAHDLQAGDVLVVAGRGVDAYAVATDIARRLRLDQADVLLAAPSDLGLRIDRDRRISGPVDARRRSGPLRRAEIPTIVAVDAPCDAESAEWARLIADALGARVMWAVVEATSKPGDIHDHLMALGRLDGLVVVGTAASRDPASVLDPAMELALPTVLVDGAPGDAEAWAALLIERIGELA